MGALILTDQRSAGSFQATNRIIRIKAKNEQVAKLSGSLQIFYMSYVK